LFIFFRFVFFKSNATALLILVPLGNHFFSPSPKAWSPLSSCRLRALVFQDYEDPSAARFIFPSVAFLVTILQGRCCAHVDLQFPHSRCVFPSQDKPSFFPPFPETLFARCPILDSNVFCAFDPVLVQLVRSPAFSRSPLVPDLFQRSGERALSSHPFVNRFPLNLNPVIFLCISFWLLSFFPPLRFLFITESFQKTEGSTP